MSAKGLPRIAVTMGDPAGVGPEICLRLLAEPSIRKVCRPVIFGEGAILARCAALTGLGEACADDVHPLPGLAPMRFEPGVVSGETGAAAFRYVTAAISAAMAGEVDAVTTAPLNKEALGAAGIAFPGHTEIFATLTGAPRACMLQYSDEVRASFVTVHVGYFQVPELLTIERIVDVIELTHEAMKRLRSPRPKLAVLGLNPHAGEHGLFGRGEEERIIAPAIAEAKARGVDVEGPLPPDTAFLPEKRRAMDALVCMYHDQGHIPLKALAFDRAVNLTLGLPIIRTSVDHGTACDIAWRGKANPGSLFEAVKLAARLAGREAP
jgi:4-hydroxythreonine-4-phosphate dehydrogenase